MTAVVVVVLWVVAWTWAAPAASDTTPTTDTTTTTETQTVQDPALVRKVHRQQRLLAAYHRRVHGLVRTLHHNPQVSEALALACSTYGSCSTLTRRAWCESRDDPRAQNASGASGLFQFLPSTFRSTPYGRLSVWSPYANALAA